MKKNEIKVGGVYVAKVNNKLTNVRVDHIRKSTSVRGGSVDVYDVTNLSTGRKTMFRSAVKFKGEVKKTVLHFQGEQHELKTSEVSKSTVPFSRPDTTIAAPVSAASNNGSATPVGGSDDDVETYVTCESCDGTGTDEEGNRCDDCGGKGEIEESEADIDLHGKKAIDADDAREARQQLAANREDKQNSHPTASIPVTVAASSATSRTTEATVKEVGKPSSTPAFTVKDSDCSPIKNAGAIVEEARKLLKPGDVMTSIAGTTPMKGLASKLVKPTTNVAPHIIVKARAGCGKTTTLVEGLKYMRGISSKIVPSIQQKAIWDSLKLSSNARSVCFVAFNKGIATELQERVPSGCEAMTMHSLGFRAVQKAFGRLQVSSYVVADLVAEHMETDIYQLRRDKPGFVPAVEELVSKCKMNLVEDPSVEDLMALAEHFSIEMGNDSAEVYAMVPTILKLCRNPKGRINFDDMIWLAVHHNLPVTKYDLLLVDECQDLNRAQQALAKMSGKRIVMVGDDKQAVYGFAGADVESLDRMTEELKAQPNGCEVFPLTVTRRCGRAIVQEANRIVEDFQAHESNSDGIVSHDVISDKGYRSKAQGGDMILCRVNAPLVRECFMFLRAGKKANIQGRDIGQGLIALVKKLVPNENDRLTTGGIAFFCKELSDWRDTEVNKEQSKKNPNENRILAIEDKADCLACFTENLKTVSELMQKIETLFTDDRKVPGIRLSSCHKSKGLEARRVFILLPKGAGMPHPMCKKDWQVAQDMNLLYVAITRAQDELVFCNEPQNIG